MTGKTDVPPRRARRPSLRVPPRVFVADAGAGAHLWPALSCARVPLVWTPRHAEVLVVAGAVNERLAPALHELARAAPLPARVVAVQLDAPADAGHTQHALPDVTVTPMPADGNVELLLEHATPLRVADMAPPMPVTLQLPSKQQREMATEPAVLSLGPFQPFTAGPLRALLVCDGEQVDSAEIEGGYAHRGLAEAMRRAAWRECAELASALDPLAPITGRVAFARAVEQVAGVAPDGVEERARESALALERAENRLWWATRMFLLLAHDAHARAACGIAAELSRMLAPLRHPSIGAAPSSTPPGDVAREIAVLAERVAGDRALRLRTAGIGGAEDVQSRLLRRLDLAQRDAESASRDVAAPRFGVDERPPAGAAAGFADGPRGDIEVRVESDGGPHPARVEWRTASATMLGALPDALAGQKLADAEIILASLDISTPEAEA